MKRKLKEESKSEGSSSTPSTSQVKGKGKQVKRQKSTLTTSKSDVVWPEYFNTLFKTFKAINTVLAFVSSKKQLAVTFSAIRTSVEAQLKRPLEISSVAEIKALLPDLVKFSYIPKDGLQIHGDKDKDFRLPERKAGSFSMEGEGGNVLVLELSDNLQPKKSANAGFAYSQPPTITPAALKKLIDKRNDACKEALDHLVLQAGPDEDPVDLLQDAAREYIPSDPAAPAPPSHPVPGSSKVVPEHNDRPSIASVIEEIVEQPWYKEQILHHRVFEPKPPQIGTVNPPPSREILQALADSRKITGFYSHQARAIEEIRQGHHVVVSTSTASGKSIVYQVPLLMALEKDPDAKAIFVYPTKALAQDQKASLQQLLRSCEGLDHLKVDTYDGDTPQDARATVRETASVIFTNFDTIHASILPHEDVWRKFLKNVKLFVVDELHYYTGLFGSHVALILRRFRRVSAAVGNRRVQFISCTATLANSATHMQKMFGLEPNEVVAITEDGAPSSQKDFVVWNPPLVDPMQPALGAASSISEASGLMRFLMKKGIRVILFCKIRKVCELAMKTIKADLSNEGRYDILKRVRPYRGGYSREDRRKIEADAFSGQLLGIVATNALELGVDIGVLDAVIMLGFPMTVPSFRQQAGRAGCRSKDSLIVLLTEPFAVDQYYANHPEELFERKLDELMVDVDSKVVLEAHLQCASYEMPIAPSDETWFGEALQELCDSSLIKDKDGWYHPHPNFLPYPAAHVSIRGAQDERYLVVEMDKDSDSLKSLEEVEVSRAMFEVYEGGVFLHQGMTFITKEVSHDTRLAKVIRADVNYHTSPRDYTDVNALRTYRIRRARSCLAYYGKVHVHVKVFGFFKIRHKTILDAVEVDTPPWERDTTGFWIDVPKDILTLLRSLQMNVAEAIHAAEHAFLIQFPLSEDVKTECKAAEKEYKVTESTRKRPARLIFYDSIGKGGGVSARAFDNVQGILEQACDIVGTCLCEDGCTKCVQSPACKEANQVSSKLGALIILKGLLGHELNYSHETLQEDIYTGPETIIDAPPVLATPGIEIEESL